MSGPNVDVSVHLVVGCQVYDLGMVTQDADLWRAALAALLRDSAAQIAGETMEEPCPADG